MNIRSDIDLVQDENGQASGDKGKMKATTPISPGVDRVRSGKAKPQSTKDLLANMRKQRNMSGTPVLMARRKVTPDTYRLTDILLRHCCDRIRIMKTRTVGARRLSTKHQTKMVTRCLRDLPFQKRLLRCCVRSLTCLIEGKQVLQGVPRTNPSAADENQGSTKS